MFSQPSTSSEVGKAIDVACSLVSNAASSLGSDDLVKVSLLLDDMCVKVKNELKERNSVHKEYIP